MYQVIKMRGDFEPWWFLEGWKDDLVAVEEFEDYYQALKVYKAQWLVMFEEHEKFNSKSNIMTAFWHPGDQRWCEECEEPLQQYNSLALLKDWEEIPDSWFRPAYEKKNEEGHHPACSLNRDGIGIDA